MLRLLPLVISFLLFESQSMATVPLEFADILYSNGWNGAVGLTFASDGRMFVWQKNGTVWNVEADGHKMHTPLIDISEEVGNYGDHGLLGFAVDPDFYSNGYIYLLYVVDHHHLTTFGTPGYDPNFSEASRATIGRITRYTALASNGFLSVDPNSRLVLVGETISTGFPILHLSHGLGSLVFGEDGTLLASCGDAATFNALDAGGTVGGSYAVQGLTEGIISPKEDVGSFRAQLVDSLNGKIIRIDPSSGDGLSSNPFFDATVPRSAKSRVWALGLRNPFRMTVRPGSGGPDPATGTPGVVYLGDVGGGLWEDINVVKLPGMNFGWPLFEGYQRRSDFFNLDAANLDEPNPLFGTGGCTQQFFYFRDLIEEATLDPSPVFSNPCDITQAIPPTTTRFLHARPAIDIGHGTGPARTGIYQGNDAAVIDIGAPGSPVIGPQFGGNSSTGGVWYTGNSFPAIYQNTYFHGDFAAQWIRNFIFTSSNDPIEVRNFVDNGGGIVAMAVHPIDGDLYYISYTAEIHRISSLLNNQPPQAVTSADVIFGGSPLTVQFTGSGSTDPEQAPLQYAWNFGDGSPPSNTADPLHTFFVPSGLPTPVIVTLTVTDELGSTSQDSLIISVNNTPPIVTILSPLDGALYPVNAGNIVVNLTAAFSDAEYSNQELLCEWQTVLHHNNHDHPEQPDPSCPNSTVIAPVGCFEDFFSYSFICTISDPAGLSVSSEVFLFPDCNAGGPCPADCSPINPDGSHGNGVVNIDDLVAVLNAFGPVSNNEACDATPPGGNGVINIDDLVAILNAFGPCN